jgi:cbb3-type cytochrome oxidase subunit 3
MNFDDLTTALAGVFLAVLGAAFRDLFLKLDAGDDTLGEVSRVVLELVLLLIFLAISWFYPSQKVD